MFSVIFDMDGTLLDTQRICISAWEEAGREQGISGLGEHIKHVCGMNSVGWLGYLKERYPSIDEKRFYDFCSDYIINNLKVEYKEGVHSFLSLLHKNGILCAVASGSSKSSVMHHIREVDGEKFFGAYACGDDVEHCKPAPDVFLLAAEKLGVAAKDCYAFEDSSNGVLSAHAAGMRVIGIEDIAPFTEQAEKCLWLKLDNMKEAIEIFRELIKKEKKQEKI